MKTEHIDVKPFAKFAVSALVAAASFISLPATGQDLPTNKPRGNWNTVINEVDGGHVLGNPDAEARMVEFMSYTCSHCAEFTKTGESAIKLLYVPSGKVSYEVRHLIRDPVDLTAALAAQCGAPDKFFANHTALLMKYPDWMAKARSMTQAQMARWNFGSFAARSQAIASDLDFYEIMETRGYSRIQLDDCLKDETRARAIAAQSQADAAKYGLRGTPTFIMGGETLDAHDWPRLQPYLDALYDK